MTSALLSFHQTSATDLSWIDFFVVRTYLLIKEIMSAAEPVNVLIVDIWINKPNYHVVWAKNSGLIRNNHTRKKSNGLTLFCFIMQMLRENPMTVTAFHTAILLILVTKAFLSAVYCMLWISLIFEKSVIFYFLSRHKLIDDTRNSFIFVLPKRLCW